MDDKPTTSSGNRIYETMDDWLDDKEPPTFDFDRSDEDSTDDES